LLQLAAMMLEKTTERPLIARLGGREQSLLVWWAVRDRGRHRFVAGLNGDERSTSSVDRETYAVGVALPFAAFLNSATTLLLELATYRRPVESRTNPPGPFRSVFGPGGSTLARRCHGS
jgi:hypothetical protein